MDEVRDLINEEVYEYRLENEAKENDTKKQFFNYLLAGYSLKKFNKWLNKRWDNSDLIQMKLGLKKVEKLIDKKNQVEGIKNTDEFLKLTKDSKFEEVKDNFKNSALEYYKKRLEISKKVPDKAEYLNEFVNKYDKYMANIPYFKNGKVYSWHTLSDYSSMLYNTNLTRTGWNRTMTTAKKTKNNLIYISAHPFACPLCMQWQGKYYTTDGRGMYPSVEEALKGGLGHPNCKHVPTIAISDEMHQENNFNSPEWEEKYKIQQKLMAVDRARERLKTDLSIYKKTGNQTSIDRVNSQLKKLNTTRKELRNSIDQW